MISIRQGWPLLIVCLITSSIGCNSSANSPDASAANVLFTVILSGDHTSSGLFENRKIEVFKDQNALDTSLARYNESALPYPVDFSIKQVILINMGERPSGGYAVEIETIESFNNYALLRVAIVKPGEDCILTQTLTSPFIFVEIESTQEILISETLRSKDCTP